MIRFLIPKAGFILRMQIYAVYRNTQTILRTFSRSPMALYAVGIAQMPSINTPTIRVYAPRSTQEYKRHYTPRMCVDSFAQFGLRTTAYGV